jgi:hypothetical protein
MVLFGVRFIPAGVMLFESFRYENQEKMKKKSISAEQFDARFDQGEDVVEYLALEMAERPGLKQRRVSVDFPAWMVQELDREASRLGITRQSVIKFWISEKLHPLAG